MMCQYKYKMNILVIISIVLSLILTSGIAGASEGAGMKADPGSNATWSGKGGKDSGRENFQAWCTGCHGDEGKGDGPLAESLGENILPRDLTDASILSDRTDSDLFKVIKLGGPAAGFSEAMPAQGGGMLTDEEVENIILYIRADLCKCKHKGK